MAQRGEEVHLVILIHGLWGSPAHLAAAKEELEAAYAQSRGINSKETHIDGPAEDPTITTKLSPETNGQDRGSSKRRSKRNSKSSGPVHESQDPSNGAGAGEEELVVVIAGGMTSQLTYDGVDVCASRVAWEVDQQILQLEKEGKKVTRFSVTGYSLGGLVARYLIGLLHSRTPSFFDAHTPETFSTIATPHLGIPRYNTFLSSVLVWLGARLLSRSGEQLYVADRYSDQDSRPLLEIMADPSLVFSHALEQFQLIQIFANGVNDHTVPYPSAAIETTDHFAEWENQGLRVESDEGDIITGWSKPPVDLDVDKGKAKKKKRWGFSMGNLPPVLRYRFPFNYLILLLFPIMLPLVIFLMIFRLSLDTRRSQRRLQSLAQTTTSPSEAQAPSSPVPSAHGLSIQSLREAIRRVEREIESDLISNMDSPHINTAAGANASHYQLGGIEAPVNGQGQGEVTTKVIMKDSQLRMALWLNSLPLKKYITWYPDIANAHALAIVRDPIGFPAHNRGRGLLRRWAKGVLSID